MEVLIWPLGDFQVVAPIAKFVCLITFACLKHGVRGAGRSRGFWVCRFRCKYYFYVLERLDVSKGTSSSPGLFRDFSCAGNLPHGYFRQSEIFARETYLTETYCVQGLLIGWWHSEGARYSTLNMAACPRCAGLHARQGDSDCFYH